ncbi:MAG: hypothetical protein KAG28_08995 [Cocleimonas sp.]|nr:hypothetical protein [Cocleimonas sp.]
MSQTVRNTLQLQIDQLTREILNATEKAWEAQKSKNLKQNNFWIDEKSKLTEERSKLQKKLHQTPNQENTIEPRTRQEIKERILSLNKSAHRADNDMRLALEAKQLSQANDFLRQRNQFNAEVKHLNKLLNPESETKKISKRKQSLTPEKVKEKIIQYQAQALEAEQQMRQALDERQLEKANELLQQKNYLNVEVEKLQKILPAAKVIPKNKVKTSKTITESSDEDTLSEKKTSCNDIKQSIKAFQSKALSADRTMRDALREKDFVTANEWLLKRTRYNAIAEKWRKQLEASIMKPVIDPVSTNALKDKRLTHEEIKQQLKTANENALIADAAIRTELKAKKYKKANEYLKQRNQFITEAKRLTEYLKTTPPLAKITIEQSKPLANANKKSMVKQGIAKAIDTQYQTATDVAHHIAKQYVSYRLDFVKFFHKKTLLETQIKAEKEALAKLINKKIEALQQELQAHQQQQPKPYVEDNAHNDLILHLLDKKDERGVDYYHFPEISKTTMGAPLKLLKSQQDLNDFIQNYTEEGSGNEEGKRVLLKYFIRDIIQVKSPLTICDLVLDDAIMETSNMPHGFVHLFDQTINKVNQEISRLQVESTDPLMPTVLRPINSFKGLGHRDAIQLIPPIKNGIDQFAGAKLSNTTLQDNIISSEAKLQGIFSTDGAFDDLKIINNKIHTEGEHKICILGMLNGEITGNIDWKGKPLPIKIQPLRLGGGLGITNFFILGFSEGCSYQYGHIKGISDTPVDRRSKKVVAGKGYDPRKYLLDFNMDVFLAAYKIHDKAQGRFKAIQMIIDQMVLDHNAVKCSETALAALENNASLEDAIEISLLGRVIKKRAVVTNQPMVLKKSSCDVQRDQKRSF